MCFLCLINKVPQTTYCERGNSVTFFAEPINAFTSLAFAIFLGWPLTKKYGSKVKLPLISSYVAAVFLRSID